MSLNESVAKYQACMEEIKRRVEVVEKLIARKFSTPYVITDVEFACIQVRKILELIALSSVVANKDEFAKVQNNLDRLWNAKKIMEMVNVVNQKYYPEPIVLQGFNGDANNTRTQSVKAGFLTQDEFLNIYSRCGGLLHAQNPFAKSKEFSDAYKIIDKWIVKIKKLLNQHVVNLVDQSTMIIVLMNFDVDGKVSIGAYGVQPQ